MNITVRRHFVPMTNCPTGIFWATNCPRWQNVPLSPHATNCPSDKMSHFLPGDKMSHWWSYWKTIVSLAFFGRQIVPRWQNVPLSPRRQNVPTYALMHMKVMESCWDILSPVKKAIGTICRKWKRPVLGIFGGYFSVRRHYNITVCYKNIRERQVGQFVAIEKENKYWAHLGNLTLIAIQKWQRNTNTKTKAITKTKTKNYAEIIHVVRINPPERSFSTSFGN